MEFKLFDTNMVFLKKMKQKHEKLPSILHVRFKMQDTLSSALYCFKQRRGFLKHQSGWSRSVSENAQNSLTTWYFFDPIIHLSEGNDQFTFHTFLLTLETE